MLPVPFRPQSLTRCVSRVRGTEERRLTPRRAIQIAKRANLAAVRGHVNRMMVRDQVDLPLRRWGILISRCRPTPQFLQRRPTQLLEVFGLMSFQRAEIGGKVQW